jgi:hypothetical protein
MIVRQGDVSLKSLKQTTRSDSSNSNEPIINLKE